MRFTLEHLLSYRSKTKLNADLTDPLIVLCNYKGHGEFSKKSLICFRREGGIFVLIFWYLYSFSKYWYLPRGWVILLLLAEQEKLSFASFSPTWGIISSFRTCPPFSSMLESIRRLFLCHSKVGEGFPPSAIQIRWTEDPELTGPALWPTSWKKWHEITSLEFSNLFIFAFSIKELRLCHKLNFSNPFICVTTWCQPLIFQT